MRNLTKWIRRFAGILSLSIFLLLAVGRPMLRFIQDLEEWAKVEQMPKLEGKRMSIMLAPKPKK